MMIKCFYALVLFSALTFAQVTDSFNISGYIRKLYYLDPNPRLSTSQTDQGRILTSMQIADSLYKQIRYTEAIKLYEQADYYALKNQHNKERFVINYFLSDIYQSIGFSNKANEYWGITCSFFNSLDRTDSTIMTNLYKARRMEHSSQFYSAILYHQENISLLKKKYLKSYESKPFTFQQKIDLALEHNIIAYDYLKNNNLYEAKKSFEKTELYLKDINIDLQYQTPYYYLCKAMIATKENKREEARKWFDSAEKIAEKKGYQVFAKRISEEKILSKIGQLDDHSSKSFKEFFKKILLEIQKVNELEIEREEKKVTDQNSQIEHWKSFFILLTAILTLYIIIKDKKIYKKRPPNHTGNIGIVFTKEIKHVSENDILPPENFSFINLNYENITRTSTLISEAKESELLEKLNQFETGTDFMAKNFTLSNLASILDTNTKYVHYLLKAHRNKNFNDYINGLKIKYIVHCLCKEPKFQNYKISYLADIGGFSSQSRFAYIFKKEVGLSPSEFIRTLKRKNKIPKNTDIQ